MCEYCNVREFEEDEDGLMGGPGYEDCDGDVSQIRTSPKRGLFWLRTKDCDAADDETSVSACILYCPWCGRSLINDKS